MGQRRGRDEQEPLAGDASPGWGSSLMGITGDTELALPWASCHVRRISRGQNDPSTPLMESLATQCRVRSDPGDLSGSPSSRTSSGKGWAGASDAKPRSPAATLEPPARTPAPLQCRQHGPNPGAWQIQGEEKQLGRSGAMLLANNRGQAPLTDRRSPAELVCTA